MLLHFFVALAVYLPYARSESFDLPSKSGWQYLVISVNNRTERFALIELQRRGEYLSRELLIADYGQPSAEFAQGSWRISAQFSDIEGWAQSQSHHSVQVPIVPTNV